MTSNTNPYLSVVVPTYNEERRIGKTLSSIREFLDGQDYDYEVLVVDDGSGDTTPGVVEIIAEGWPQLKLLFNEHNQGKGAVVRQGMLAARGQWVLFTDADNATPISELDKLLPHAQQYEVVIGSRHCPGAHIHVPQAKHRILLSRASNLLIRLTAVPGVWDTQCGFKLFQSNAGKNIFANVTLKRWGFDFEALMIARRLGYPIKEVGIEWYNDPDSKFANREAVKTLLDLLVVKWRMLRGGYDRVGYIRETPTPRY